jgi:hypothetical protein
MSRIPFSRALGQPIMQAPDLLANEPKLPRMVAMAVPDLPAAESFDGFDLTDQMMADHVVDRAAFVLSCAELEVAAFMGVPPEARKKV